MALRVTGWWKRFLGYPAFYTEQVHGSIGGIIVEREYYDAEIIAEACGFKANIVKKKLSPTRWVNA